MTPRRVPDVLAWECRYFFPALPRAFTPAALARVFVADPSVSEEDDVYIIGGRGPETNLKMRRRSGTLKLRRRLSREGDGFELWKQEVNEPFPLSRSAAARVAETYELPSSRDLEGLSTIDEVLTALAELLPGAVQVPVRKRRRFYRSGNAELEVSEVGIGSEDRFTVAFASPMLTDARSLMSRVTPTRHGQPQSYVEACRALARALGRERD